MLNWIKYLHRFSVRQALYPMLLSTMLACLLYAGRVYWTRSWVYLFLVWNLFLAWIPYWSSFGVAYFYNRHPRLWWLLPIPGVIWLAFFPNAPYLLTDFLHLQPHSGTLFWYDVVFISAFAWTGLFLAVFSLRTMQNVVKSLAGAIAGWLFVAGVIGLSGLGIFLGRFLHWNSWDVLFHPKAILKDMLLPLTNPLQHTHTFAISMLFATFLLVCYLTITAVGPPQEQSS